MKSYLQTHGLPIRQSAVWGRETPQNTPRSCNPTLLRPSFAAPSPDTRGTPQRYDAKGGLISQSTYFQSITRCRGRTKKHSIRSHTLSLIYLAWDRSLISRGLCTAGSPGHPPSNAAVASNCPSCKTRASQVTEPMMLPNRVGAEPPLFPHPLASSRSLCSIMTERWREGKNADSLQSNIACLDGYEAGERDKH